MSLASRIAKRLIPSAQGAADTFLAGTAGGAVGAGLGASPLGGGDDVVPGMLAGAGMGMGALGGRGLVMALMKKFPQLSPQQIMQMIARMGGE